MSSHGSEYSSAAAERSVRTTRLCALSACWISTSCSLHPAGCKNRRSVSPSRARMTGSRPGCCTAIRSSRRAASQLRVAVSKLPSALRSRYWSRSCRNAYGSPPCSARANSRSRENVSAPGSVSTYSLLNIGESHRSRGAKLWSPRTAWSEVPRTCTERSSSSERRRAPLDCHTTLRGMCEQISHPLICLFDRGSADRGLAALAHHRNRATR